MSIFSIPLPSCRLFSPKEATLRGLSARGLWSFQANPGAYISQRAAPALQAVTNRRGPTDNEATIIRLVAQGHTNEGIATILDTTEGAIKDRRWLTALAKQNGVADLVEAWDKSGGNQARAARIQRTYANGRKPKQMAV